MGITLQLIAGSVEDLLDLADDPERFVEVTVAESWRQMRALRQENPLLKIALPSEADAPDGAEEADAGFATFDLEKSWDAMHQFLTDERFGRAGSLSFLRAGGREVGEETGFGAPRLLEADEVADVAIDLRRVAPEERAVGFKLVGGDTEDLVRFGDDASDAVENAGPFNFDAAAADEELAVLVDMFGRLRTFVQAAASRRDAMLIAMT
ncbi:MAG: DUF1877 family protein [Planctomycetota bacterium]